MFTRTRGHILDIQAAIFDLQEQKYISNWYRVKQLHKSFNIPLNERITLKHEDVSEFRKDHNLAVSNELAGVKSYLNETVEKNLYLLYNQKGPSANCEIFEDLLTNHNPAASKRRGSKKVHSTNISTVVTPYTFLLYKYLKSNPLEFDDNVTQVITSTYSNSDSYSWTKLLKEYDNVRVNCKGKKYISTPTLRNVIGDVLPQVRLHTTKKEHNEGQTDCKINPLDWCAYGYKFVEEMNYNRDAFEFLTTPEERPVVVQALDRFKLIIKPAPHSEINNDAASHFYSQTNITGDAEDYIPPTYNYNKVVVSAPVNETQLTNASFIGISPSMVTAKIDKNRSLKRQHTRTNNTCGGLNGCKSKDPYLVLSLVYDIPLTTVDVTNGVKQEPLSVDTGDDTVAEGCPFSLYEKGIYGLVDMYFQRVSTYDTSRKCIVDKIECFNIIYTNSYSIDAGNRAKYSKGYIQIPNKSNVANAMFNNSGQVLYENKTIIGYSSITDRPTSFFDSDYLCYYIPEKHKAEETTLSHTEQIPVFDQSIIDTEEISSEKETDKDDGDDDDKYDEFDFDALLYEM